MKTILIIGGNRFFGRHLAEQLIFDGHEVTLLNRGKLGDGLGSRVKRLIADRDDERSLVTAIKGKHWDVVYDQVCYTAIQAGIARDVFKNRTNRYVVTSSESVYDSGENQSESEFDPGKYSFSEVADSKTNYQEAKRQVETVMSRETSFEVAIVRPSLVVGLDDYTGRFKWHLERVLNRLPIFFPNLGISSDFIRSDQAGQALKTIGLSGQCGPINLSTPGSILMKNFISICESATNQKAVLLDQEIEGAHSPYGGTHSKTMNTDLLQSLGFRSSPSDVWMADLASEITQLIR